MNKGGKNKAPKVDTTAAQETARQWTPTVWTNQYGPLGGVDTSYNTKTGQILNRINANPLVNKAVTDQLQTNVNLDRDAEAAGQQAFDANYAPIQRETRNYLDEMLSEAGPNGLRNSRFQDIIARNSDQLAEQQGRRLQDIRQQGRGNYLDEVAKKYNLRFNPYQTLFGVGSGMGTQLAGQVQQSGLTRAGFDASAANANAQMQLQRMRDQQAGIGSAIGGGISLLSAFAGR